MFSNTTQIYITDKTGKRYFNTLCSTAYIAPERRNLERHLAQAITSPEQYKFLDIATARIEIEGDELQEISDDELLEQLGAI